MNNPMFHKVEIDKENIENFIKVYLE